MISLEKKFWRHVDKRNHDECWPWTGPLRGKGYGHINHMSSMNLSAHRVSWILHNGFVPEGKLVLHRCDNPACVNPSHLYIGTYSDNNMDREYRNPGTSGRPSTIGARNTQLIIDFYKSGKFKQTQLSKIFGISRAQVSRICTGKQGS
ncbi:unnamed protein product, partial [marine sediment metagenome]